MIYFTSDLHFDHKNVIEFCNRPFKDVADMNQGLIDNWNAKVRPDDEVYVLGDFSFGNPDHSAPHLNGRKYLIKGNHDAKKIKKLEPYFEWIKNIHEMKWNGNYIVMCHYAMRTWNKSHYGSWHLYGHSHGSLEKEPWGKSMDVGVDSNNYMPISIVEVSEIMDKRKILSNHH